MTRKRRFLPLLLSLLLFLSAFALPAASAADTDTSDVYYTKMSVLEKLIQAYSLYSSEEDEPFLRALSLYFDEHPDEFMPFMNYVLKVSDKYGYYLSKEEYDEAFPEYDEFSGIGVEMDDTRRDAHVIKTVFEGSPAEKAGILAGDEIVLVDGVDATYLSLERLTPYIRGAEGTKVNIGVRRDGAPGILTFTVTRAPIEISNVAFQDLGDGVAYIELRRFQGLATFLEFTSLYEELPYMGFRSVIVDVRNNPGGDLDVLANILNYVVPDEDKAMFALGYRDFELDVFRTAGLGWKPNKMVVLMNEYSASAAEIFAGSLAQHGYATLVGKQTYGKGVGQFHLPLGDGSYAVITNFEVRLPSMETYNEVGIAPDVEVDLEKIPYPMPELSPLTSGPADLTLGATSDNVKAFEERLAVLNYFTGEPDDVFDEQTLFSMNAFQKDFGFPVVGYMTSFMLKELETQVNKLAASTITVDTQLEAAFELAKEAAKAPLSYTLPPKPVIATGK